MFESTGASTTSPAPLKRATDIRQVAAAVSSRFDVLELTGAYETCAFYLARDRKNPDLPVLLKVLSTEAASEPGYLELFYLEAEAAARLRHGHIIRSSKATSADGFHFMAIEHRPGLETLRRALDQKGWLEPALAVGIARQIADALDYAHGLGVLHLNLQPENLLLDRDGSVLVTNFGIEGRGELDLAQRERARRLPAHYMSPEQAKGERLDHGSDLYSLGIVLFEMLTDRVPFNGENSEIIKRKQVTQSPLPAYVFSPSVSRPVSEITMQLLEKRPEARFPTGGALVSVLNRLCGIGFSSRVESRVPAPEPVPKPEPVPQPEPRSIPEPEPLPQPEPDPLPEPEPVPAAIRQAGSEPIVSHVEAAESSTAALQGSGKSEEREPYERADTKVHVEEAAGRNLYESPAISIINYPARQFYESASSEEIVAKPSKPPFQPSFAQVLSGINGFRWQAALVVAAVIVAVTLIALARASYLPGIFDSAATEEPPAASLDEKAGSSEEPPSSSAEAGSQGETSQPASQEGGTGTPVQQADAAAAAAATAAAAAPRVQSQQVKKAVRRPKYKPRRYYPTRRTRW
ncbi:MAG TPA: serine/threonine-protein kinase [Blastocatellia bacterium]|nr:serine/threonine-protein kinase [Blastocatellia bacterium]